MKIFFILLLIINSIFIIAVQSRSDNVLVDTVALMQVNPEKIKSYSSHVSCLQWGGFVGTDLLKAETAIAELELGNQLTQLEMDDVVIHWVYIPPLKTAQDALSKIEEIQQIGVEGFRIQADSLWLNAVSIAVLHDIKDAQRLVGELKNKGLTSVTMVERSLRQAKFIIREPTSDISKKIKLQARRFNNSELKKIECKRL